VFGGAFGPGDFELAVAAAGRRRAAVANRRRAARALGAWASAPPSATPQSAQSADAADL